MKFKRNDENLWILFSGWRSTGLAETMDALSFQFIVDCYNQKAKYTGSDSSDFVSCFMS